MKSAKGFKFIFAVAFTVALILGPTAEAGSLLGMGGDSAPVERQVGLFGQAFDWLAGLWNNLTATFDTATAESMTPSQSSACTDSGDSGWGLDPEGCPRP